MTRRLLPELVISLAAKRRMTLQPSTVERYQQNPTNHRTQTAPQAERSAGSGPPCTYRSPLFDT